MKGCIVAGTFSHAGRTAIAYYNPWTQKITWRAADRDDLTLSRNTPELDAERALKAWLA